MWRRSAADVLGLDADADFHRGAAGIVDRGEEGDEFADMDRLAKHHLVDRQRHGIVLGEARGAGIGDPVEQVQQRAAMHLAGKIRHVRRHQHDHVELAWVVGAVHAMSFLGVAAGGPSLGSAPGGE